MRNVRCGVCISYLEDGKCKIKRVKVSASKKRSCDFYVFDDTKLVEKQIIPTTRVMNPTIAKKQRYRARKAAKLEELKNKYFAERDKKHPLTGNLDMFKTTASEDK